MTCMSLMWNLSKRVNVLLLLLLLQVVVKTMYSSPHFEANEVFDASIGFLLEHEVWLLPAVRPSQVRIQRYGERPQGRRTRARIVFAVSVTRPRCGRGQGCLILVGLV